MMEAAWLAGTDPELMLAILNDRPSRRQQRLFAVACCRRIWHLLRDESPRSVGWTLRNRFCTVAKSSTCFLPRYSSQRPNPGRRGFAGRGRRREQR